MVKSIVSLKKVLLIFLTVVISFNDYAQSALGSQSVIELDAFENYQSRKYNDVIADLGDKNRLTSNEQILLYLSELQIGKSEGAEIEKWLTNHPKHPLRSLAQFKYSEYAFYQGDVTKARKYLAKVNSKELSEKDRASHAFISGVLLLEDQEFSQAKQFLNTASRYGFPKPTQLSYYQSYTDYHLNDLESALIGFKESQNDPEYAISSKYFIAKILLEQEHYDEVIKMAQEELTDEISETNSGFYQLLGEAYASQEDEAKADAFFEKAIEMHPGKPSSALYYQAGVSKFKIGNKEKALTYLTKSGIGSGPYAKLSAFQLGRLHIQRDEPEKALVAYMEASSSDDEAIKEESIYQSANLNAKLERYAEAINYSNDYLESFPGGKWLGEIQNLIALSYLKTSDYDQAISQLEANGINSSTQKDVYQKVTYQKALLLFNDGNFSESDVYFTKSLRFPMDQAIANESYFYLGEINFRRGLFKEASAAYGRMQPLSKEASYGMGYIFYNQRKYQEAITHFEQASAISNQNMKLDAQLRLADCYYATKSYQSALNVYKRLPQSDYVFLQQGMVLRNLESNEAAVRNFDRVPATSTYKDDAIFYKAQTAFENAQFSEAESGFSSLITRYDNSSYKPAAYLNRAISRNNLDKIELARNDYRFVLDNYLQREEAFNAILGLQDLQQKGVEVPDLEKYIAAYKRANPDDGSLEVVEFEAAKGTYFDLDYEKAITKINSFLKEYPQSKFRVEATYYLGDAYYRSDQLEESRRVFDDQRFLRNNYTSRILYRLGSISLELEDYDQAIEDFKLLLESNFTPKDSYNARNGLMQANYQKLDFEEVIIYADEIIKADWKPLNAEQTAKLLRAKSLVELNRIEEAKAALGELAKGEDQFAAEASYLEALLVHEEGDFDESLELLFDFTARLGSYTSWVEKAYLLISENYIAKDELFQAKATLRSIIQHSQNEETKRIATDRLEQIEQDVVSDSITSDN